MTTKTKTAGTAKATTKSKPGGKKKEGLRVPQVRILAALAKHGELNRLQIADKASVDKCWVGDYIGLADPVKRKAKDKKILSLLTLGYAKDSEAEGPAHYKITPAGRKALAAVAD